MKIALPVELISITVKTLTGKPISIDVGDIYLNKLHNYIISSLVFTWINFFNLLNLNSIHLS